MTAQSQLLGLDFQELSALVERSGEPEYRARQLFEAIYAQRVDSVASISTLPRGFRDRLGSEAEIGLPEMTQKYVSADGTIRYLMGFRDGQSVETVWMPEGDGGEAGDGSDEGDAQEGATEAKTYVAKTNVAKTNEAETGSAVVAGGSPKPLRRATICVSSQVGCAVNCQFCMTALLGMVRNLSAGEMVGQILRVLNDHKVRMGVDRINLVFMGQGEPFLNYEPFMKAVRLLVDGVGFAANRMTVSTSGIVPRIYDFAKESIRPKLAISLNAPNDELRDRLIPINRKWDLAALMAAARAFPLRNRERITFEYVLLDGVNDAPQQAREVVELLRGMRAKVNLIALNPGPEIAFGTPAEDRVQRFQQTLIAAGTPAFLRRPRGRDIYAACGQLKRMAG